MYFGLIILMLRIDIFLKTILVSVQNAGMWDTDDGHDLLLMNITLTYIIITALATYRLTRLVLIEDGPFDVALKLRGALDPDQRTWLGKGMACPWCISFWIGLALAYLATYTAGLILVSGLAASALVGLGMTYGAELTSQGLAVLDRWRRGK